MAGVSDTVQPIRDALDNPVAAPQMAEAGEEMGKAKRERPPFPRDAPIICLGISSDMAGSQKCYYLDVNKQLVGLEAGNRHGKNSLIALFGDQSDWLEDNYPKWSKPIYEGRGAARVCVKESEIIDFDQADASRALIEECTRRGIFSAADKMRGPGAHPYGEGGLLLHFGDKMLHSVPRLDGSGIKGWQYCDPGLYDGYVYTGASKLPRPAAEDHDGMELYPLVELVSSWNWKRELLDPHFLIGAIGAGFVGGALKWRPNVWITGGAGTGKSTLNGKDMILHRLFGPAMFRTDDTTEAGIRQSLKNSTIPVMLDELEAKADNRKVNAIMDIARVSSTGGKSTRGGGDGTASDFALKSPFWFSSINIPPLETSDRSRLAILELKPLKAGAKKPVLSDYNFAEYGRIIMRRMVTGWPRLEATIVKFQQALSASGHDARAQDQFGTLLACADIVRYDHDTPDGLPDDEEVAHWCGLAAPSMLAEVSEAEADHDACLQYMLTSPVQARGGDERVALGSWVADAVKPPVEDGDHLKRDTAARRLQQMGLKLVNATYKPSAGNSGGVWGAKMFDDKEPGWLAVAGKHQSLAAIFKEQSWQGGVWRTAMARILLKGVADGEPWEVAAIDGVKVKFGPANSQRAVLVPLAAMMDEDDLPRASHGAKVAEWLRVQMEGDL